MAHRISVAVCMLLVVAMGSTHKKGAQPWGQKIQDQMPFAVCGNSVPALGLSSPFCKIVRVDQNILIPPITLL